MTRIPLAVGLALREVKLRYDESVLGLIWVFLSPLLLVAIYAFFFGKIRGAGLDAGDVEAPFSLHLFAGYIAWDVFGRTVGEGPNILRGNATILTKVRIPLESVFHARVLYHLFHTSFACCVLIVAMFVLGLQPGWALLALAPLLVVLVFFTTGMAILVGVFGLFLKDLEEFVSILLLAWLFATPIFYYEKDLGLAGGSTLALLYRCNPMYWFVEAVRDCTLAATLPPLLPMLLLTAGSFAVYGAGRMLLRRSRSLVLDVL